MLAERRLAKKQIAMAAPWPKKIVKEAFFPVRLVAACNQPTPCIIHRPVELPAAALKLFVTLAVIQALR